LDPALVLLDKKGKPYIVRYDQVNAMFLNEFLKEHRKSKTNKMGSSSGSKSKLKRLVQAYKK